MNKIFRCIILIIAVSLSGPLFAQETGSDHGPLVYEYNLKGPATIESEVAVTSGTIKSINASWDFTGEASMEVSADGGISYTKIINGRPLIEGFVPGNRLRFKLAIGQGSILRKVVLGYIDTSGLAKVFQNPELVNFQYRKPIYIAGGSKELFNYPLKIAISYQLPARAQEKSIIHLEGKAEPDFRDIRFIAADGQTPLDYYLETVSSYAIFWVKVPQIPREGMLVYVYYGNKEAKNESDGDKVFLFFDNFKEQNLDEAKWLLRPELKGEYTLKDGDLRLNDFLIITRNFKMRQGVIEFKAKAGQNSAIQAIVRGRSKEYAVLPVEQVVYSSAFPGAEHTIAVDDVAKVNVGSPIKPFNDYIYRASVSSSGIIFERYSNDYKKEAEVRFLDVSGIDNGYIGLKASGAFFGSSNVYFDWVRVRPFVEKEPKVQTER